MDTDISQYLSLMANKEASDLFFTVGAPANIKIHGKTHPIGKHVLSSLECQEMVYSLLNDEQVKTFEDTYELNMAISYAGIGRFRVNVYRQRGEVAMVVRYIKSTVPSVTELGLPIILQDLIMEKSGLILVVGATGSGKSTSLAAMVDYRNSNHTGHILTIEDLIEFLHSHKKSMVDQREVGLDTRSYSDALKNALREAPDAIVVGEIRDRDTMQHAIHYAETGHICLSTLHASNTYQTLERVLNFFPDTAQHNVLLDLSQHLRAVVAQRLIPTIDGGRVPAVEVLINTPFIAELIEDGRLTDIHEAMTKSDYAGMVTFDHSLYELVIAGKISPEEAFRHADSKNNLRLKLRLESTADLGLMEDLELSEEIQATSPRSTG